MRQQHQQLASFSSVCDIKSSPTAESAVGTSLIYNQLYESLMNIV